MPGAVALLQTHDTQNVQFCLPRYACNAYALRFVGVAGRIAVSVLSSLVGILVGVLIGSLVGVLTKLPCR